MRARPDPTWRPAEEESVEHELEPVRIADQLVNLQLTVRHAADGAWRGRLRFHSPGTPDRETAEIFCATSEADLWQSVRALGTHHLRALYLSLA